MAMKIVIELNENATEARVSEESTPGTNVFEAFKRGYESGSRNEKTITYREDVISEVRRLLEKTFLVK
jgi:hypothetical protein